MKLKFHNNTRKPGKSFVSISKDRIRFSVSACKEFSIEDKMEFFVATDEGRDDALYLIHVDTAKELKVDSFTVHTYPTTGTTLIIRNILPKVNLTKRCSIEPFEHDGMKGFKIQAIKKTK